MATQLAEQIEEIDAQRRAAEAERERAVSAEEKALLATKAKSIFLANMSHELRTPLTAIMGYSTILQRELRGGSPQAFDDLRRINSSGQHLLELINDVLDLAKIEAGRITLDPRPFDVVGLVDEVTSSVQPLVDRNGNALSVDISQALPLVELDRTRTGQILLNLLSNAAKFTKHGRIDLRVFAESDPHDDWIVFEVKDSGIGIPPKKLDVIFEAFGQADSSTTREFGGTGANFSGGGGAPPIFSRVVERRPGGQVIESRSARAAGDPGASVVGQEAGFSNPSALPMISGWKVLTD